MTRKKNSHYVIIVTPTESSRPYVYVESGGYEAAGAECVFWRTAGSSVRMVAVDDVPEYGGSSSPPAFDNCQIPLPPTEQDDYAQETI